MPKYITLAEFKANSEIPDGDIDAEATRAIDAAEEAIDRYTWRRFDKDTEDVVRYYTPTASDRLRVHDLVSVTTLKTDDDGDGVHETTWAASEFLLAPYGADDDGKPFTVVEAAPPYNRRFYGVRRGVEITGIWGWPAVPAAIEQATIMQATRILKRAREAPFGVAALSLEGTGIRLLSKLDPDVEVLLRPLRKARIG